MSGDVTLTPVGEVRQAAVALREGTFRGAMTATPMVAAMLRAKPAVIRLLEREADKHEDDAAALAGGQVDCDSWELVLEVAREVNAGPR